MLTILVSLIGIATFNGCEKITDTTRIYYDETFCADPWGQSSVADDDKKKNIEKYLKGKSIKIFKVEILNDRTPDLCKSCGCKSGKRISCKVKKSDLNKAINVGFYQ